MSDKEKVHARYLVNPDTGKAELVHADEVADRQAGSVKVGWKEPEGLRPNGEPWNAPEDAAGRDAAAENALVAGKAKAKQDAEKAAELEKSRKANEAAAEEAEQTPDFKVQVVTPPKKAAAKKSTRR